MKLLSIFPFMAMNMSSKDNVTAQDYTEYYNLCNQAQVEMANDNCRIDNDLHRKFPD